MFPQEHRSSSFILFALFIGSPFRNYSPICSALGTGEEPVELRAEIRERLLQLLGLPQWLRVDREVSDALASVNLKKWQGGTGSSNWLEIIRASV